MNRVVIDTNGFVSGTAIANTPPSQVLDLCSTVVFWLARDERSSRHDRLLLGEPMGKNIFSPLSELESLVGRQDQRLDERLGLLATRFPDGLVGEAALGQ